MSAAYSIIIPAYNEESFLPKTLEALFEAMRGLGIAGEVVVVDNNSSDRTAEIASGFGARVVFEPHNQISMARNAGGRAAEGGFLLFLDADTRLPRETLLAALDNLQSGRCCGGGARVDFDDVLPLSAKAFLCVWNSLAPRLGLAAGSFVHCRREFFLESGGFSQRMYAGEELDFSRRIAALGRKSGMRFIVDSRHGVVTSARKMRWHSQFKLLGTMLLIALCPPLVRSRRACRIWYERPGS